MKGQDYHCEGASPKQSPLVGQGSRLSKNDGQSRVLRGTVPPKQGLLSRGTRDFTRRSDRHGKMHHMT